MKTIMATGITLMMALGCFAETSIYVLNADAPSVSATANYGTTHRIASGQPKVIAFTAETNVSVSVVGKIGHGGSLAAERVILDYVAIDASGYTTNLTSAAWLGMDSIWLKTKLSSNAVNQVKAHVITAD